MTDIAATIHAPDLRAADRPKLDTPANPLAMILFFGFLAAGILYMAYSIYVDVGASGTQTMTYLPYLLLFVALLIALGFEFVNGFHDTANAVATVIYTHSLPAPFAVVWAGFFNFLGVVLSSGAVAFGIISLLPVELILQVGTSAGFAMVFALLFAAIIWNLGTWYLGLPASSSHTLIGSIIGVGVANALMHGQALRASTGARRRKSAGRCCSLHCSAFSPPRCCCWRSKWSSAIQPSIRSPRAISRHRCGSAPPSSPRARASPSPTAPMTARRAWVSSCSF